MVISDKLEKPVCHGVLNGVSAQLRLKNGYSGSHSTSFSLCITDADVSGEEH